jgi:hypothetical protein
MAKIFVSPRLFLIPMLGLWAAACSTSDDRPQVVIDLQLGAGVSAPQTVHVSATQGTVEVKSFEVLWKKDYNPNQVGLVFPTRITGQVSIAATAYANNVPVAQGQLAEPVTLTKGESGPYTLVLNASVPSGNDGGANDGAVDQVTADTGATGTADTSPWNNPEGGMGDAGVADAAQDSATGDTIKPSDTPTGVEDAKDAKDAPTGLADTLASDRSDAAVVPADAAASDVPHTFAWEPASNVQNDPKSTCYGNVVAVDPTNEHVYAAWVDDTTIKVKRWNRLTATWEKTVTLENRGNPNTPGIGVDVKGNVMVLWPQDTKGANTSLDGVWMARSTDGSTWSPPVRIAAGVVYDVTLAMARNGTGHAAYSKKGNGNWSLFTAYYDGTSWAESSKAVEPEAYTADFAPQIALGALGDGLMIYYKGWGVAGTVLTGTSFTDPLMLDPNNATVAGHDPSLAVNRKGEGVVVWTESPGASTVILGRTYNPGTSWSSVTPPIVTEQTVGTPAAALDEQGNITLVWQEYVAKGGYNLVGMHGRLDGTWSDVATLESDNRAGTSATPNNQADPKLAVDGSGNVLLVWRKDLSEGKTSTIGVYGSRYAAGTWLPQAQLGLKTGLVVPYLALAVADSGLGAVTFRYIDLSAVTTDPDSYSATVALFR